MTSILHNNVDSTSIVSQSFYFDWYTNSIYEFKNFPEIHKEVETKLQALGYKLSNKVSEWSDHGPGNFTIQGHTISVEEHTDDTSIRFGIMPIRLSIEERGNSKRNQFSRLPVLNFYNGRKKESVKMYLGEIIIFQPWKPHSLIFYGYEVTYIMFDVEKLK